jgi:hypothetical protein
MELATLVARMRKSGKKVESREPSLAAVILKRDATASSLAEAFLSRDAMLLRYVSWAFWVSIPVMYSFELLELQSKL